MPTSVGAVAAPGAQRLPHRQHRRAVGEPEALGGHLLHALQRQLRLLQAGPAARAPAAEGVQELPHAPPARRLRRPRRAELVRALLLTLMMLAIGMPSSVRSGIAHRVVLICFLFAVVGPGQVEAARFRAAQAQLRLLRHREARDRHVQVVQSKNSSCQGTNLAGFFFSLFLAGFIS